MFFVVVIVDVLDEVSAGDIGKYNVVWRSRSGNKRKKEGQTIDIETKRVRRNVWYSVVVCVLWVTWVSLFEKGLRFVLVLEGGWCGEEGKRARSPLAVLLVLLFLLFFVMFVVELTTRLLRREEKRSKEKEDEVVFSLRYFSLFLFIFSFYCPTFHFSGFLCLALEYLLRYGGGAEHMYVLDRVVAGVQRPWYHYVRRPSAMYTRIQEGGGFRFVPSSYSIRHLTDPRCRLFFNRVGQRPRQPRSLQTIDAVKKYKASGSILRTIIYIYIYIYISFFFFSFFFFRIRVTTLYITPKKNYKAKYIYTDVYLGHLGHPVYLSKYIYIYIQMSIPYHHNK
eukprot:gene9370-6589_t